MIEFILMLIGLLMMFAAGDSSVDVISVEPEPAFDQALYDRGINEYLTAYCGSCHMLDAAETRGNFGPGHNNSVAMARAALNDPAYNGEATSVTEYIRESVVNPRVYYTEGYGGSAHPMPAYTNLTNEQLDAIVYMLSQQN